MKNFIFLALLSLPILANGQDAPGLTSYRAIPPKFVGDTIVHDTILGTLCIADSMVRMVSAGSPGTYQYQNVSAPILADGKKVVEYRFLVKGDGTTEPFDISEKYLFLSGGVVDRNRILFFIQNKPKTGKK